MRISDNVFWPFLFLPPPPSNPLLPTPPIRVSLKNKQTKTHRVKFVLPPYSWVWSLWQLVDQWSNPKKETDLPIHRTCQLSTSPQLGDHEPLSSLSVSLLTSYILCGPCAGNHRCFEFVGAATCNLQKTPSCCSPDYPLALTIHLCLLPWWSLPLGDGGDTDVLFVTEQPTGTYSLHSHQL